MVHARAMKCTTSGDLHLEHPIIVFYMDRRRSTTIYFDCDFEQPDPAQQLRAMPSAIRSRWSIEVIIDCRGRCVRVLETRPILKEWWDRTRFWFNSWFSYSLVPVEMHVIVDPEPWTAAELKWEILQVLASDQHWGHHSWDEVEELRNSVSWATTVREAIEVFRPLYSVR